MAEYTEVHWGWQRGQEEAIAGSSYHLRGWENGGKGSELYKQRRLQVGLAELTSLSSEEAPEGLSPILGLMLVSLRLGCNEAGPACVGQLLVGSVAARGRNFLCCSVSVTRVVLKGVGGRQEGGSPLLLPSPAVSLLSFAG